MFKINIMGIGVELDQRRRDLIKEYYFTLKSQTQKLASTFPTIEELHVLREIVSELSTEAVDEDENTFNDRELMAGPAYDFEEIKLNDVNQIVWRGSDYFPNIGGTEYFVTKDGELVRGELISKENAGASMITAGRHYRILKDRDDILDTSVVNSFILPDDETIEKTISRWT